METPEQFILDHVKIIEPLNKKAALAYWSASISGSDKDFQEYEQLNKEIRRIYNNKEEFEKVKKFLAKEKDLLTKRQLEILYNNYLSSQGDLNLIKEIITKETKLEQTFNKFRAKINDKELTDNEIKEILRTETKSENLKAAWEASKKQGEVVEKDLVEVITLRNKLAQGLGFKNYYVMSLEASEQKEEDIITLFDELSNLTDNPFKKLKDEIDSVLSKKYKIPKDKLSPWHYQDLFFQQGPKIHDVNLDEIYAKQDIIKIAKEFYSSLNLPVEDILEKSSLYEKAGKSQHAFCIDIDRNGDVRILENVKNDEYWASTTLHELGHAVYSKFIDKNLPYLLRDNAHIFTTEAIALLFERDTKNLSFIKKYCNLFDKEIEKMTEEVFQALRLRQLVFSRWAQVMVRFEKQLYENPNQNLNKLWWQLVKKYQLIDFTRDKPDWASKIHFVTAPVYYHNYFLGELLASQLHHQITKNLLNQKTIRNVDYSGEKKIGEYLKEKVFGVGKKYKWNEMIKKATGEELTARYFVDEFINETEKLAKKLKKF
jgi:peptidyl-dipeptidase A